MKNTIEWTDWLFNVLTALCIFAGGSVIVAPDYVHELTSVAVVSAEPTTPAPMVNEEIWAAVDKEDGLP